MADRLFEDPRLAAVYDPLDPDRSDLDVYVDLVVDELGAESVLDVGCGTGTFACLLAARGLDVVAVDPAEASVDIARGKPHADDVRWVVGDVSDVLPLQVDVATMTANVAQVFVDDDVWLETLRHVHDALHPGGVVVFETRDPDKELWREWTEERSRTSTDVDGVGSVEAWVEVTAVQGRLVTFRWTYVFATDGAVVTSDSTLVFRSRSETEASLRATGFVVTDVRDAPDRPGRELVFLAQRS